MMLEIGNHNQGWRALGRAAGGIAQFSDRRGLRRSFWLAAASIAAVGATTASVPIDETIAGWVIIAAALLPMFMWTGRSSMYGKPIFPIFAATFILGYGFAFLNPTQTTASYDSSTREAAAVLIVLFLVIGTAFWWLVARSNAKGTIPFGSLEHKRADTVFISVLVIAPVYFHLNSLGYTQVLGAWTSVVKSLVLSSHLVALFYVGYRWGRDAYSTTTRMLLGGLVAAYCIVIASGLLLVGAMLAMAFVSVGYFLGSGRIPWWTVIVTLVIASFLHQGKHEMRRDCWGWLQCGMSTNYLEHYSRWIGYSMNHIVSGDDADVESAPASIFQRGGLANLFLMVHTQSPEPVPFLGGGSYAVIPQLLVPRIINPERVGTHEGTTVLNMHYGLQTREDTASTTIGWGLLNEAYANFGVWGIVGLGIVMGAGLGVATRWAKNRPMLSLPSLFCLLLMGLSLNTEASAGVFLTSLSQATVGLILLHVLLQRSSRSRSGKRTDAGIE